VLGGRQGRKREVFRVMVVSMLVRPRPSFLRRASRASVWFASMRGLIFLHGGLWCRRPTFTVARRQAVLADERLLNLGGAGRLDGLLAACALGFSFFVGALRVVRWWVRPGGRGRRMRDAISAVEKPRMPSWSK